MKSIIKFFAGKKTHFLVAAVIVLNTLNELGQGGDLLDTTLLMENLELGIISTFKMGVDRLLGK
jgi:hypothetical protein